MSVSHAMGSLTFQEVTRMQSLSVVMYQVFGSLINLDGPGHYAHWGFIQISVANLVVIGLMVVVFVAAILIPFRRRDRGNR